MVHISKTLVGYNPLGATVRAPDRLKTTVGNAVYRLEKLQVKQNLNFSIADNGRYAQELRGELKSLLGGDTADSIMKGLTLNALRDDLHGKISASVTGESAQDRSPLAGFGPDYMIRA